MHAAMGVDQKILIVSDNKKRRATLLSHVQEQFSQVFKETSGQDALKVFKQESPAIVFCDLVLSDMTGVELTSRISAENRNSLVIILAESSPQQLIIDALKAGACDYLTEPISADEVKSILLRCKGIISRQDNRMFKEDLLKYGKFEFSLASVSRSVPPAVNIIRSILTGYIEQTGIMRISLALDEVLRNAYEHGNLEITSEEKVNACNNGTFEKLLREREQKAVKDKKVTKVTVELEGRIFKCIIEDEGPGFDWKKINDKQDEVIDRSTDLHGRGVFVVKKIFDEVTYNDKGNIITLMKKL